MGRHGKDDVYLGSSGARSFEFADRPIASGNYIHTHKHGSTMRRHFEKSWGVNGK